MADEPKKTPAQDITKALGEGAVAAAVAYGTTHNSALAVGAAALKVGPVAWSRVVDFARDRYQKAAAAWGAAVETQLPPQGEARDKAAEDSPEVILDHLRRLMEGVDPAVVPALGRLAGAYIAGRRKPDEFFRGATRMLCDFTAEELRDAQRILRATWGVPNDREYIYLTIVEVPFEVRWSATKLKSDDGWEVRVDGVVPHAPRFMRALRLAGLAEDGPPGEMDLMMGPGQLAVPRETARELARIVGSPDDGAAPAG